MHPCQNENRPIHPGPAFQFVGSANGCLTCAVCTSCFLEGRVSHLGSSPTHRVVFNMIDVS